MSVLHPTLLAAGLAAIALPILIHLLFRRRYVPVRWAAMRFIQQAQTQQRRRRKIEQILLLIARCLLIALIAIAIAHPVLGGRSLDRERTLVLIIDNSLASATRADGGDTDLEGLKRVATERIDGLRATSGDRVAIIAGASPAATPIAAPTGDLDAARLAVEGIRPADSAFDLAGSLGLASAMLVGDEGSGGAGGADARGASVVVLGTWRRGALGSRNDGGAGSTTPAPAATGREGLGPADRPAGPPTDRRTDVAAGLPTGLQSGLDTGLDTGLGESSTSAISPDLRIDVSAPTSEERANLRIRTITIPRGVLLVDDTPAVRQAIVRIDRTGPLADAVDGELLCTIRASDASSKTDPVAFRIPAGQRDLSIAVSLPIPPGLTDRSHDSAVAVFSLRADPGADAIVADSTRRAAFRIARDVQAGLIRSRGTGDFGGGIPASAWVAAALSPDETSPVRVREIAHGGVDAASLLGLDLVVLARPDLLGGTGWETLGAFVDAGGSVLLFAPPLRGAHAWIDAANALFAGLEGLGREAESRPTPEGLLPGAAADALGLLGAELGDLAGAVRVTRTLPFDADPSAVVLATSAGVPVVTRPADRVWLVTAAISPDWSDMPARPIFPALVQEIARQSPSRGSVGSAVAGMPVSLLADVARLTADSADASRGIGRGMGPDAGTDRNGTSPASGAEPDAAIASAWRAGVRVAGAYGVEDEQGSRVGILAVNADAEAGDTGLVSREQVAAAFAALTDAEPGWTDGDASDPGAMGAGSPRFALWAFAAAVLLALIESLIAVSASGRRGLTMAGSARTPRGAAATSLGSRSEAAA